MVGGATPERSPPPSVSPLVAGERSRGPGDSLLLHDEWAQHACGPMRPAGAGGRRDGRAREAGPSWVPGGAGGSGL
jgi:hypothetical protein